MRRSVKTTLETRKYRLKRRSSKIGREIMKTLAVIIAAGGLGMVLVYGYNFAICSSYFQLQDATVRGCVRVHEGMVLELAGVVPSMNILTANLEKMAMKIRTNPWVREAFVGRELPNRLVIEIEEHIPAALIRRDKNLYLVDRGGIIFKGFDGEDRVDLPLITGMLREGAIHEGLLKGALSLLDYISRSDIYPRLDNISEIYGDPLYGYTIYTNDRHELKLGYGQYEKKLRRLEAVLLDLAKKDTGSFVLSINLMELDRIIVQRAGATDIQHSDVRRRTRI